VDPAYIGYLDDPSSGFNKVLVKDIKLDLFKNYGKIRSTDLLANNKRLEEDWDPADTFQTIIACTKQCWEFAINAGQPYSEEQVLAKACGPLYSTPGFTMTHLRNGKRYQWDEPHMTIFAST
jgi:hypothetical protein